MIDRIEERDGDKYHVNDDGDLYVLDEVYKTDEWGMNSYRVKDIFPGTTVLDIGANKGIFSVWAARRGANVTSYEPNPITYEYLLKNIQMNQVDRLVDPHLAGVWSEYKKQTFYANNWNSGGSTLFPRVTNHQTAAAIDVQLVPLDDILGDKYWDIVKIDTEGAEYEILLNSQKLNQIKFLTIECHYWNESGGNPSIADGDMPSSSVLLFDQLLEKLSDWFVVPELKDQREYPHGIMLYLERRK